MEASWTDTTVCIIVYFRPRMLLLPRSVRFGTLVADQYRALSANKRFHESLLLTIAVEDYFQGKAFSGVIDERQWPRFETRVEKNTLSALELLERSGARATFFFSAWIAGRHPDLVREVVRRGHEVASAGDSHRGFRNVSWPVFRDEAIRAREALESAAGVKVYGFRAADHRLSPRDLWALRVLSGCGYDYDSSVNPCLSYFRREPWRRFVHEQAFDGVRFWEVPLSSVAVLGLHVPVAGGNWFRQLPETAIRRAVDTWTRTYSSPFVMYFRVWDLDESQPIITGAPVLSRVRHYRNPERVPNLIESFLAKYSSCTIAGYLGLESQAVAASACAGRAAVYETQSAGGEGLPVTVVIPCYNEHATLPYLANTLEDLKTACGIYRFRFIFVDDGSSDATQEVLQDLFEKQGDSQVLRHEQNQGVAAAILTGIRSATTEVICSMDCDCTYDPQELLRMIPKLSDGVDLVTASPYHPAGRVERVPAWRLGLSRAASLLYRIVLRQSLYTYTSCFRVYRRSAVLPVEIREKGFLGVAELLGRLDLSGSLIVEHPATLRVRMLGRSKMRVPRTIAGHLRLIGRFGLERLRGQTGSHRELGSEFAPAAVVSKGMDRD